VFKAMAGRPKDVEDATALLLMHRDIDLARVRRRLAELAELADEPALIAGLEAMIATARKAARRGVRRSASRSVRSDRPASCAEVAYKA